MSDTVFKIAAVDIDARCNNITPFFYKEMDRQKDIKTGRVFTSDDINQAWETFMKITNSTDSNVLPCCDQNIKLSDVSPELISRVQGVYKLARPIIKNGDLEALQLTNTDKPKEAGWQPITPYIICKLNYALLTPGVISQLAEDPTIWVVPKSALLMDCYTASCQDSITVENLFGISRKDPEYTYIDDASVARAIKDGDIKYIRDYLFKYNNANQVLTHDDYNNRLVHIASTYYNPKIFELLVAVKANFNVRNAKGDTPIHLAVKNGNLECLEQLIKLNVEINPKNNRGETPMMLAIAYQPKSDPKTGLVKTTEKGLNMIMVRYLYNHGGSVLDKDANGNNLIHIILLHMPATREMSDAVKYMLNKGVTADEKNNAGITPLMLAADKLKATGVDDMLPPAEVIDTITEGFTVNEVDITQLTEEQQELMEIRTLLFNDIIRNNPNKYNNFISVTDIPQGAPIEVLDHNCVTKSGQLIDNIDTKEQCLATPDGHWVKIKKPTTMVKLELLPESKMVLDAVPDDKLYYPKYSPSTDTVPVPELIQQVNAEAQRLMAGNAVNAGNSKNTINSTNAVNSTNAGNLKEGFSPVAAAAGLLGSHHLTGAAVAGAVGSHALGFAADVASDYIRKSITDEPEIDPDNLSGQKRPNIPISGAKNNNTNVKSNFKSVSNKTTSLEHPPIKPHNIVVKEEFFARQGAMTASNLINNYMWNKYLYNNWVMITVCVLLSILLIWYVSNSKNKK